MSDIEEINATREQAEAMAETAEAAPGQSLDDFRSNIADHLNVLSAVLKKTFKTSMPLDLYQLSPLELMLLAMTQPSMEIKVGIKMGTVISLPDSAEGLRAGMVAGLREALLHPVDSSEVIQLTVSIHAQIPLAKDDDEGEEEGEEEGPAPDDEQQAKQEPAPDESRFTAGPGSDAAAASRRLLADQRSQVQTRPGPEPVPDAREPVPAGSHTGDSGGP